MADFYGTNRKKTLSSRKSRFCQNSVIRKGEHLKKRDAVLYNVNPGSSGDRDSRPGAFSPAGSYAAEDGKCPNHGVYFAFNIAKGEKQA